MGLKDLFKKKPSAPDEPPKELPGLIEKLGHADWRVRLEAARALGALGPRARGAVAALEEHITDENGDVCNAAADALSRIEREF